MDHSDRELVCASCGQRFLFSGGEQAYYSQNGLQEPRRCKPCRAQRKTQGASGGERQPQGGGPRGPRTERRAGQGPRAPQRGGFRLPSPDDPNGYRAPGFQTESRGHYAIDYAGLPKDEDDENDGQAVMLGDRGTVDRQGMRTDARPARPAARGGQGARPAMPRGMNGRRADRSGTDPDAYRSPGFANSAPASRPSSENGSNRRARRAQRMRHEATCGDCGVQAFVPFQPGPDRPAYCKGCYQTRKANGTAPVSAAPSQDAPADSASE
jgi:CxxC-x17-CxxC domain-containing protein